MVPSLKGPWGALPASKQTERISGLRSLSCLCFFLFAFSSCSVGLCAATRTGFEGCLSSDSSFSSHAFPGLNLRHAWILAQNFLAVLVVLLPAVDEQNQGLEFFLNRLC